MNWGLMGGIYALFHAVHGIADYWLQTDWQAQNKSKDWLALSAHILSYTFLFLLAGDVLWAWTTIPKWKLVLMPFVVAIPHGLMDRRWLISWFVAKTKGWKPGDLDSMTVTGKGIPAIAMTAAIRNHVSIALDQKFHYLCLLLTAMWLACGVPA